MVFLKKAAVVGLILASAACTNPDRFGGAGADSGAGAGADAGTNVAPLAPTGANDPTSPLFFTQTIGDRVLFVVDSSTLTPAGQQTLNGQANWLKTNADRLRVISYGKERPIEVCASEACYSQNRRAVTVIAAGGLS